MGKDEINSKSLADIESIFRAIWILLQLYFKGDAKKDEVNFNLVAGDWKIEAYYYNSEYWQLELSKKGVEISTYRYANNLKEICASMLIFTSAGKTILTPGVWKLVQGELKKPNT